MARLQKIIVTFPLLLSLAYASYQMEECPSNPDPEKEDDCTCNSEEFVNFFSSALAISPSMKDKALEVIIMRTDLFKCYKFFKLPPQLDVLMSDSVQVPYHSNRKKFIKKKVFRKRIKRQVSLGYPTNDKWKKIIPELPRKGRHHYAPLGSHVILKCYASHDDSELGIQEEVVGDSSSFMWRHINGMEITAPLTSVDRKTGDLTFHRVRLADTSTYNCTVTTQPENGGDPKSTSYLSQLDVVAGSTFWLRFGITFATDKCRHEELVVVQQHVPDWVHRYVCHFCPVRNVSLTCSNLGEEKYVQLTVAISTLGFEELLSSWSKDHVNCNMECQKRIHAKILNVTSLSILKLFSRRIEVRQLDGPTSVYRPLPNTHDEDLADACPPGFFLTYSLCFPCAPGTYSPTGPAECFPCAEGFFQPNPGSSACFHCPSGSTTRKTGALSQADCIAKTEAGLLDFFAKNPILSAIIGCVLLLLLLLWLLVCCCCPRSCLGKLFRCVPCCGDDDGEEKEIGEEKRRLTQGTSSEFDSDTSGTDRSYRRVEFREEITDDGGGYDDDGGGGGYSDYQDFRAERTVKELIESTEEESMNPTIKRHPSAIIMPEPGRLDIQKYEYIQPMIPDPPEYRRREYCQTTLRNQQKQRKEEEEEARRRLARQAREESQAENTTDVASSNRPGRRRGKRGDRSMPAPSFPRGGDGDQPGRGDVSDTSQESSGKKRFFARHPHLRLGNVLHKSKSLMAKLAEQKMKLKHLQSGSSSESIKSLTSPSRRKLLDKPKQPLSALKKNLKDKSVTISESKNTVHPKKISDTLPRTASKSDVVKDKNDDKVKKKRKRIKTTVITTKLSREGSKTNLSREGSKTNLSREGSKTNLSREGSKTNLSREGSKTKLGREGSKTKLGREGSKTNLSREGSRTNLSREGSKTNLSREGSRSKIDPRKETKIKNILSTSLPRPKKSHTKRDRELIPEKSKPSSRTTVLTRGMTKDRFENTMKKMLKKELGSASSSSATKTKSKKKKK